MNYLEIFNDVVSIMREDYSGCLDKKGWDNHERYREFIKVNKELTDEEFSDLVNDYLLDFKEPHMWFRFKGAKNNNRGFKCRVWNNRLFVSEISESEEIEIGDEIIALDQKNILEVIKESGRRNYGEKPERMKRWNQVFQKYNTCTILRNNEEKIIDMKFYEMKKQENEYSLKVLDDEILLMTLSDFMDQYKVEKLIEENEDKLDSCEKLIIDVRNNGGGMDSSYYKLMEYLVPEGYELDLDDGDMEINYSKRNCDIRIKQFEGYLSQGIDSKLLRDFLEDLKKNYNKGFKVFKMEDEGDYKITGRAKNRKVVVLCDMYCGSSGDAFIKAAKSSPIVTVMGRNSAGVTDYSNLAIIEFNNKFSMGYPTSRSCEIDKGKGIQNKGIEVHEYIPWTPEHLKKDMDLEKAIEFLNI
ncbi:S41 family peptidase [Oceanirhabdus sp. W0125-5]|uniref:S41 family peptidase n=1 Tax=Oceanirhabdus sp. W0125-5 TaxID=2999116 RepID=UPI0022F2A6D2|nr:S41 family peptidase [Oceanirhabdus sp. W0125-5]WBW99574.1 S41 family peptidase [Oceanirhabdus sp. W0125-5]